MIKVNIIFLGEKLFCPICFSKLDSSWWSESDDTRKPVRKIYSSHFCNIYSNYMIFLIDDILHCFNSTKTIYFTGERIVYFDTIAVLPTGGEMFWKYFYRKLSTGLEDVIQGTECVQNSTNLAILISKLNYSIGLTFFFKKKIYIFL